MLNYFKKGKQLQSSQKVFLKQHYQKKAELDKAFRESEDRNYHFNKKFDDSFSRYSK
ncbi:hypothetical protein KJR27_03570 [Streptococcus infantarius subsp. infantarius]|uniref:hypothetical protein n=1 Tax=Streptococcus infantarius TaxID=102684 RepID=UPI001BDA424B|nr:hypothetical protein [Streptococcus infantarius]MBT0931691.1 hypothetical protein [Streptococcus infantarius subsp. infantarius]